MAESSELAFRRDVILIIPTHSHPSTLAVAVESAQNQTFQDLDIVVIGDGVSDASRDVLAPILKHDERVSFIDRPKAVRHGEEYRDEVIRKSAATKIAYLGDDDLLFPDHISTLVDLLPGHDFVNTLPIFINVDGSLTFLASDLANPESVKWHLDQEVRRNTVSLTGVMHNKSSYLKLPYGWRPAPVGRWTDHYMWEQYFSSEGFKGKTSSRATTAKFNQANRNDMGDEARGREVLEFAHKLRSPGFVAEWDARVGDCVRESAVLSSLENTVLHARLASAIEQNRITETELSSFKTELENIQEQHLHEKSQHIETQAILNEVLNSKSWKVTEPLRKFSSLFKL